MADGYNFKKFESLHKRTVDKITITKSGAFGFPSKFYQDNQISEYKYVVLFFDVEKQVVGLNFTNSEEEKSKFSIIKSKGYGGQIVATSFFKVNGISPAKNRGKYDWKKVIDPNLGDLFVIELARKE